ncbi:unnamed protein product, partial [Rhizoctonia solani]
MLSTLTNSTGEQLASQSSSATAASSVGRVASSRSTSSISASSFTSSGTLSATVLTNTTRVTPTTQSYSGPATTTPQIASSSALLQTSSSQSSTSQTSATLSSITAATTSFGLTSTLTPQPTTRQPGVSTRANSTSLVTISYEVSFTSQSSDTPFFQSSRPTTTSEPEPTITAAPEVPGRIIHRLIFDLGECAGFTSPRFLLNAGELGDLVTFGEGKFVIEMKSDLDSGIFGFVLSLKDDEVRVHWDIVFIWVTGRCIWLEDGVTWDAHLANSPDEIYHCWGWSDIECPYGFKANGIGDALWTLSSDNPTGDAYVEFCPPDGPPWFNILTNPNPDVIDPTWQGTYVVLPTQTAVSTSTFIKPVLPTKLSAPAPSEEPHCDIVATCVRPNTFIVEEETTTSWSTFITPEFLSTHPSTTVVAHTTATVPSTSFLATPRPTAAPSTLDT